MVHEHKFKDPLSSTCHFNSEGRVLDLELEVLGNILVVLVVTFCHWNVLFCFGIVALLVPILALLLVLCVCGELGCRLFAFLQTSEAETGLYLVSLRLAAVRNLAH